MSILLKFCQNKPWLVMYCTILKMAKWQNNCFISYKRFHKRPSKYVLLSLWKGRLATIKMEGLQRQPSLFAILVFADLKNANNEGFKPIIPAFGIVAFKFIRNVTHVTCNFKEFICDCRYGIALHLTNFVYEIVFIQTETCGE